MPRNIDSEYKVRAAEERLRQQGTPKPPAWAVAAEAKVSISTVYRMRRLFAARWRRLYWKDAQSDTPGGKAGEGEAR